VNPYVYRQGELHVEEAALSRVAAEFGTPCYVYSRAALTDAFVRFDAAFAGRPHLVCYAVKANSNLGVLDLFARLGSGFDIVSGGELARVRAAGGDAGKVVFSGVGKTSEEIRFALESGILCFNVESAAELARIDRIAGELGKRAPVSFRVNPDVDPGTHPYIATGLKQNKFGIAYADAPALYARARALEHVEIVGIDCHIGSQLTDTAPIGEALRRVAELVNGLEAEGIELRHVDVGGGLGIRYGAEAPPDLHEYARAVTSAFPDPRTHLIFEPGRLLTGNAGVLLTRVQYVKPGAERNFVVVDAAMNDLMRPALYDAWHDVLPVRQGDETGIYDLVGPVCESGDFLAKNRRLPAREGDLLAIMSAGAYGMSMASNYNTRPRPAEVMIEGNRIHLVRERETVEELFARERRLPVRAVKK
jgi:diaminopimelate decarboxylase